MSIIALIPARAGSKRIPGKNTKLLAGHPLLAYTIAAAKESGIFEQIVVSSEDVGTLELARQYGAIPLMRPAEMAADISPDLEWVRHALKAIEGGDDFAILRPTSPFRTAATIQRAWALWNLYDSLLHSLRAVEPVRQHPGKMWHLSGGLLMFPIVPNQLKLACGVTPAHSCPTQMLPQFYVQNASLEMAHRRTVTAQHSISGDKVGAFLTEGIEGFDLNTPEDWAYAEHMIDSKQWTLPTL